MATRNPGSSRRPRPGELPASGPGVFTGVARACCLAALVLCASAGAQTVKVKLHVPPSGRLGVEDLWWVTLDNTTRNTYTAYLRGEVHEARRGLVFRARTDSFMVPPGRKQLTLRNVRIRDQWAMPGYQAFITRTGLLPEGDFTYKVWLEPDLGRDSGTSQVRNPPPPRLVSPSDRASLVEPQPTFSWTKPAGFTGTVRYRLLVVEVLPGQTKEEAVRANRAWFEQRDFAPTLLRFPLSARQLERDKSYAWCVEALFGGGRGTRVASEVRAFRFGVFKPKLARVSPLVLTREVVRQGNSYAVSLNLRNNTDQVMANVVVVDSSKGFQVLDQAAVYLKFENGAQPIVMPGTFETGTSNEGAVSWLKVTRPDLVIPARRTLSVGYTMMPLQYVQALGPGFVAGVGCRVTYKVGDEQRAESFNSKSVEVTDCVNAWKTADYLLVTNPVKLYQLNSGARADVDKLLATMARLARAKKGVMLHFPASSASQMRTAIILTGTKLVPGWQNSGYLLLVGESEIVPCWDTVKRAPDRPLPWCDYQYSDVDDDDYPELRVGRIIGTTAAALTVPIRNSLAVHYAEGGARYDGSKVLLVTGVEQPSKGDNFTADAGPASQYLHGRGFTASYWGQEYFATRSQVLAKALTHTAVASGGAPTDTLGYLLAHYSETQLAAWLFAVNSPSSFSAQYPVKQTDTYFNDVCNRQRRLPTGFGSTGITQAVQRAEAVENARRGQWVNQAYIYAATPQTLAAAVMAGNLPRHDLLVFSAHGSSGGFNMLTSAVVNGMDFTSDKRRPVVVSFACWNGDYPPGSSLARAYLARGGGVFVGYTAMTSTGWFRTEVRDSRFLQYWSKSRRVGDVVWDWKNKLAQTAGTDMSSLRMLFGHNLYGDPKLGGN